MNWFYIKKGNVLGPIATSEIEELIEFSQIYPLDLIRKEGEYSWREAKTFFSFSQSESSHFPLTEKQKILDVSPPDIPLKPLLDSSVWVGLVWSSQKNKFEQKGPFTTQDIRNLLDQDRIQYSDYLWREGMSEWYKVSTLPAFVDREISDLNFHRSDSPERNLDTIYKMKTEDLLKNVYFSEKQKRIKPMEDEPSLDIDIDEDEDAVGENIEKSNEEKFTEGESIKESLTNKKPTEKQYKIEHPHQNVKLSSQEETHFDSDLQSTWISFAIFVIIAITGTLAWIFYSSKSSEFSMRVRSPKEQTTVAAGYTKEDSLKGKKNIPSEKKSQLLPVFKNPTQLKALIQGNFLNKLLVVNTDASANIKVHIYIISHFASVLGHKFFSKSFTLPVGHPLKLNLAKLGVPIGKFSAFIKVRQMSQKIDFSTEERDLLYSQKLNLYKKKISYDYQKEKVLLVNKIYLLRGLFRSGANISKNHKEILRQIQWIQDYSKDRIYSVQWMELEKYLSRWVSGKGHLHSQKELKNLSNQLEGNLSHLALSVKASSLW